ncbi:hypothetical protein ACFY4C_41505 [Actinomadura viridis]|uniref:hypothetical protein n=1 Tax=Actinomadura viridis TaxID=58110 RepID=UPI0036A52C00
MPAVITTQTVGELKDPIRIHANQFHLPALRAEDLADETVSSSRQLVQDGGVTAIGLVSTASTRRNLRA